MKKEEFRKLLGGRFKGEHNDAERFLEAYAAMLTAFFQMKRSLPLVVGSELSDQIINEMNVVQKSLTKSVIVPIQVKFPDLNRYGANSDDED